MPSDPDFPFAPADPSQWWQTRALPHILVQPNAPPNAGSTNPAGSDGIDDWFVPTPGLSQDGFPDDWFVPGNAEAVASQPGGGVNPNNSNAPALATAPSPTPSAPNPQPSGAPPTTPGPSNQPAPPRPDPLAAYWSLIPASRAGAFAWHPPIFLNSAGQFPPPASTYDPPILPAYGLFGSIAKMPATSAAANARPIGGGGGLFDSLARLPANTSAPPSIFGAIARPPYAAPMLGSNPSSSPSYPPYLGGSALPSYLADPPPPPDPTLFAWLPQLPGPTAAGDSPLGPWNGAPIASSQGAATAASPTRSVLFNHAPAAWDPGAPDRNAANLDQTARTLGVSGLSLSKSGAPFVSPPPQLLITPQQWLDVAHLVSPNLVDYFTKTPPPAPPLPSTPGKIPSSDNPYGPGAAFEAATWLLGGPERGIVGPLESVATAAERRAAEAAFKPGTFSITDWSGYNEFLPRPEGPFRILDREEYDQARSAADRINEKLHRTDPATSEGKHIHEIHPVKFGGSLTDLKNKIALSVPSGKRLEFGVARSPIT